MLFLLDRLVTFISYKRSYCY